MIRQTIRRHYGKPLTEGPIWIALVRLSVPIILSNILQTAYQLTDTFWVGRLSAPAVAAVSLAFPITFLCISLGGGLPIAGTVLIAQFRGRGDRRAVSHVAAQTLLLCFTVSLLLAIGGFLLSGPIVRFMGAAPEVLPDAVRFLKVTFLGFLFVFCFFAYQALMRGLGTVYPPMFIVLGTVLLNFLLDPFFIFGSGPIPAMGVAGAAMATLCTQAMAMAIGMGLLISGKHGIELHWADFRPDWRMMGTLLKIGAPASVEQSTQALGMTLMMLLGFHVRHQSDRRLRNRHAGAQLCHHSRHGIVVGHVDAGWPKYRRRPLRPRHSHQRHKLPHQLCHFGDSRPRVLLHRTPIGPVSHAGRGPGDRRHGHVHQHLINQLRLHRLATSADRHPARRRRHRGADAVGDRFVVDIAISVGVRALEAHVARRNGNLVGRGNFDLRLGTSHRCLVPARQLETPPIAGGS